MNDYECSCINCGSKNNLKMWAHRNRMGKLVGWVFSCPECDDAVSGLSLVLQPAVQVGTEKDETDGAAAPGYATDGAAAPGYAKVSCMNEDCTWEGILDACPVGWEQDGWGNLKYQVALCPRCGEEVEIL